MVVRAGFTILASMVTGDATLAVRVAQNAASAGAPGTVVETYAGRSLGAMRFMDRWSK